MLPAKGVIGLMYQGDVKDEFKRQHATVMWALDLLPRKYTLEERAAVVVGALQQNYVLIPRPVFEQAAAKRGGAAIVGRGQSRPQRPRRAVESNG